MARVAKTQNQAHTLLAPLALSAGSGIDGEGALAETLTGARTVDFNEDPQILAFDPGGAGRDVTLPKITTPFNRTRKGLFYFIKNTADAAETLTVKDAAAVTLETIEQGRTGFFFSNGTTWISLVFPHVNGDGNFTIADADINASAAIARSKLATDSAFIDLDERLKGADGADLALSETAGDFFRQIGTNQWYIQGEASQNETEVSEGWFTFVLPENYVAGGTISLRAVVDVTGTGTLGTCTVDFEAQLSDNDGAVGADLVTTAATAVTATAGAKDFVVTPTGLVAGDKLVCKLTTSIQETMNMAVIQAIITKLGAVIQVKG